MMLQNIKGLGRKRLDSLHAANIHSLRDILYHFPYRYKDTRKISSIASLTPGDIVTIECHFEGKITTSYFNGLKKTTAHACDASGKIQCIWFNSPWIAQSINAGQTFILYGKVNLFNGKLFLNCPSIEHEKAIIPIYKPLANISNKMFFNFVMQALESASVEDFDFISAGVATQYNLLTLKEAIYQKHKPTTIELLNKANQKILIDRLLIYLFAMQKIKKEDKQGLQLNAPSFNESDYWANFPFTPTQGQVDVLNDIIADLTSPKPMSRLVQGDVGSGKTAVALGAAYFCMLSGFQCAFMAPTEILAHQVYVESQHLFSKYNFNIGYLSSSLSPKEKKEVHQRIEKGDYHFVVGTHALFSQKVIFQNLGLVITDEQHRFGVAQRKSLQNKSSESVNVLVMSATPIPRSTALILLNDLDVSVIPHMPKGRKPVKTFLVSEFKRESMYQFIIDQVQQGKQVFIVCKHVENKDDESVIIDVKSHFKTLTQTVFKSIPTGILYGKQKQVEKEQHIQDFKTGKTKILFTTTVIEVGVNVPNANVIVIENADMYGLAQLHQLRGRVGRDGSEAWCFLMAKQSKKLDEFSKITNGFDIAKLDFSLRGPGEILGLNQHGESVLSELLLNDGIADIVDSAKNIFAQEQHNASFLTKLQHASQPFLEQFEQNITLA